MNRLRKKCIYAAAGFHLLLLLILVVGPGFLASRDSAENMPLLEFVTLNTTDGATRGGNPAAGMPRVPTPTPPVLPTPPTPAPSQQVQPTPPAPRVEVKPPKPAPAEPEKIKTTQKDPDAIETPKPKHVVSVSTTLVKHKYVKPASKTSPTTDTSDDDSKAQAKAAAARARAVQQAVNHLSGGLSSATAVDIPAGPGGGGPASANYRQLVGSIYFQAWLISNDLNADAATAIASVTIARDGTVLSARITKSSGSPAVDRTVQSALDRVKFIAPFPDGSTEQQRTYPINFNLKAKQSLG